MKLLRRLIRTGKKLLESQGWHYIRVCVLTEFIVVVEVEGQGKRKEGEEARTLFMEPD